MNISHIVVTGASGMIGSHLIDLAVSKNINVSAIVRKNSKKINNLPTSDRVKIIECDLNDISNLCQFVEKPCDAFIHLAWDGVFGNDRNDVFKQQNNALCTLKAIQVAAELGCKKFVLAGSQAEFGINDNILTCNTLPNPITAYGIAKYTAFKLGKVLAEQLGIEINCGRILSAFGEKDNFNTMVSSSLIKMIKGERVDLSECTQIWDYIYAVDVARAFLAIAKSGVNGKAYPIGSGNSKTLKSYVKEMYNLVGNNNATLNFGAMSLNSNAVKHLECDISELTADTGFKPKYSFSDGIINTIDWLNNHIE